MRGNLKRVSAACAISVVVALLVFALQCDSGQNTQRTPALPSATVRLATAPRPCNVLLLVVDTLRANRLSCYGYPRPTSPNIDRLAARGTLYRNNHSQSSWTLTSMISMMTGKSMIAEAKSLPTTVPCLAKELQDRGMETAAFIANPVVGKTAGFQRGFDTFVVREGDHQPDGWPASDGIALADEFATWYRARRQRVESGNEARRFFAWVQFIDPHQPYEPDALHRIFHGPRPDKDRLMTRWRDAWPRVSKLSPPDMVTMSFDDCVEKMLDDSNLYDGEVKAVDDGIGRILSELEHTGDLGDTLVIVCADHGEMLYEHVQQPKLVRAQLDYYSGGLPNGLMDLFGCGHRMWFYDEVWNTPLIIAGPGMPVGAVRSGMPANLDIFPTCVDALDVPRPDGLEGVSLWGGIEPERSEVFAYGYETSAMITSSHKKLIVNPRDFFELKPDQPEPLELYDVEHDPEELHDLAAVDPAETARMRRKVSDWIQRSTRGWSGTYTPEQLKVLRRLGYTGDE